MQGESSRRRRRVSTRPRVLIISGSVGAGHDGAAAALAVRLRAAGVHVDQRDYLLALPGPVRALLRGGYTASLTRVPVVFDWLFTGIERRPVVHRLALTLCRTAQGRVGRWVLPGYDSVVSTYPLASQTLGQLRIRGQLTCPVVTFLTDPAVHRLWVHPGVDHHLTVTQATADQGLQDYHVPMQVGGPLVSEAFSRPPDGPAAVRGRAVVRAELGLAADTPVALVLGGSLGLGDVTATVEAVLSGGAAVPVVVCGRNERLRRQLAFRLGNRALGWRDDMPDLMAAADVLITNAGGLSFTEALVSGLPAVCFIPIPGHGRANATVLDATGLAPWARTPDDLTRALLSVLRAGNRPTTSCAPPCVIDAFVTGLSPVSPGVAHPLLARRFPRRPRAAA